LTRLTCNATPARVAGVEVFDTQGRLVRHLTPDSRNVLTWDGTDDTGRRAGSGVHFIRFKLSDGTAEQRLVLFLR
jgi:flagellar hook assembly protein FlgD